MLSKPVLSLLLLSTAVTVSGQSSDFIDPAAAAAFSSIHQSLYNADYVSRPL